MIITTKVFDLKTFADVTLGREFSPAPALTSMEEALAFFGNDEAKILAALNAEKLESEVKAAKNSAEPWHSFVLDADGEPTETLNGVADIVPVNEKLVNDLVLNLAKQHFGFAKSASIEAKRAAKAKALAHVKTQPALVGYLTAMSAPVAVPMETETAS